MNINKDSERIGVEVVQRVMDRWAEGPTAVEDAIFDVLYHERRRLETSPVTSPEEVRFYDRLHSGVLHASSEEQRMLLKQVIERFVNEIQGHFNPKVYKMATRIIPTGLNIMMNTLSPIRLVQGLMEGGGGFEKQARIIGKTDLMKRLATRGTIMLLPTHASNLDSVLIGFALYQLGLPPFSYGAGLNLFSHRVFGFFMHNLGAYKVDRRKNTAIYKDVLKTYAGVTMELGYHNLFFPGGTRSRSGAVENRLKRGLLGTAIDAYIRNLLAKKERPDIFVIPATINYQLVLEAQTLIEDFLKAEGKSRYIIEDDEFSRPRAILEFMRKLFRLQSKVDIVFGQPMDLFGNPVNEDGQSLGRYGRPIDRRPYVFVDGRPGFDSQRDHEYTRELAAAVVREYAENTIIKPVNVVSHVIMHRLRRANPGMDIYRLIRTGGKQAGMPMAGIYDDLQTVITMLIDAADRGEVMLDETIRSNDQPMIMGQALAHLEAARRFPVLMRRGDRLFHQNRKQLLYYGNRLTMHPVMEAQKDHDKGF